MNGLFHFIYVGANIDISQTLNTQTVGKERILATAGDWRSRLWLEIAKIGKSFTFFIE